MKIVDKILAYVRNFLYLCKAKAKVVQRIRQVVRRLERF